MKFLCVFELSESVRPLDVITSVVQSGFRLVDQQQEEANQIKIIADAPSPANQGDVVEQLGRIQGCTLVRLAFADNKNEPKPKKQKKSRRLGRQTTIVDIRDEQSALEIIGSQYPRIASAVKAYGRCLSSAERNASLQEIGRKVGAGVYQRDYSLGSPLQLAPTLARELKPALKQFCAVTGDDFDLRLDENPFCGSTPEQQCCDFVVGYMFGFLSSSPTAQFASVAEVSCAGNAYGTCTFRVTE